MSGVFEKSSAIAFDPKETGPDTYQIFSPRSLKIEPYERVIISSMLCLNLEEGSVAFINPPDEYLYKHGLLMRSNPVFGPCSSKPLFVEAVNISLPDSLFVKSPAQLNHSQFFGSFNKVDISMGDVICNVTVKQIGN